MTEGGWQAFREAAKDGTLDLSEPEPEIVDAPAERRVARTPRRKGEPADAAEHETAAAPFEPVPIELLTPNLPSPPARSVLWLRGVLGNIKLRIGPANSPAMSWPVIAILPVAAIATLLVVWTAANVRRLCLEPWDILFGLTFLIACVVFLVLAIRKPARPGQHHPGLPALLVAGIVAPLWIGTNTLFGESCLMVTSGIASANSAPLPAPVVPPLPPPIEVHTMPIAVPLPMPRPPGLAIKLD